MLNLLIHKTIYLYTGTILFPFNGFGFTGSVIVVYLIFVLKIGKVYVIYIKSMIIAK